MTSVLSLFSGCGGFDSGFAASGYEVKSAYDNNPSAVETYNSNLSPVSKLLDLASAEVPDGAPDVVIGGPPCQGFSSIGARKPDDPRNNLFVRACQIAVKQGPKLIVLENVLGLTHGTYAAIFYQATAVLTAAGYHVEPVVVSADNYGVAQRRKRLFLIARSNGRPFHLDIPHKPMPSIANVLSSVQSDPSELVEFSPGSKMRLISEAIAQGCKLSNIRKGAKNVHTWDIPSVFGETSSRERDVLEALLVLRRKDRVRSFGEGDPVAPQRISSHCGFAAEEELLRLVDSGYAKVADGLYDLRYTFNGTYRRLSLTDSSPTVDTHFGNPRLFLHPTRHRGMTSAEAAAIQGFPVRFRWPASKKDRFRLVGNAVPPPVSFAIASAVKELV